MYTFKNISINELNIKEYYNFKNKCIFTTLPWINYILEDNQGSESIFVRITEDKRLIGYFSGIKIKKFGITIIGSPFPGWGTSWMGLDVYENQDIVSIYKELIPFLFKTFKCGYISISERNITADQISKYYKATDAVSLQLEIDKTDDELFKVFKTDCRNFIRQFERRGARIEIAEPNDDFAEEYYSQLIDVFDKQGLNPTWDVNKVKILLRNLSKENMVLCLRVRDPEGKSIATSIYPGYNNKFYFWAGASYRSGQHYRPNEYMIWTAIKYWRDKGIKLFDMVGVRPYKKKFGPTEIHYTIIEAARPRILIWAKNVASKFFYRSLKWNHKSIGKQ